MTRLDQSVSSLSLGMNTLFQKKASKHACVSPEVYTYKQNELQMTLFSEGWVPSEVHKASEACHHCVCTRFAVTTRQILIAWFNDCVLGKAGQIVNPIVAKANTVL